MKENILNNAKKLNNLLREMNDDWADSTEEVFRISYHGLDVYIPVNCRMLNAVQYLCDKFNQDVRSEICNELYDISGGVLLPSYTDALLEDGKALALALWLNEVEGHGAEELAEQAAGLRRAIESIGAVN